MLVELFIYEIRIITLIDNIINVRFIIVYKHLHLGLLFCLEDHTVSGLGPAGLQLLSSACLGLLHGFVDSCASLVLLLGLLRDLGLLWVAALRCQVGRESLPGRPLASER